MRNKYDLALDAIRNSEFTMPQEVFDVLAEARENFKANENKKYSTRIYTKDGDFVTYYERCWLSQENGLVVVKSAINGILRYINIDNFLTAVIEENKE